MSTRKQALVTLVLTWTVGIVILWESFQFGFSGAAKLHLHRMGLPLWFAPALGGLEILAAILFLIPAMRTVGGYSLLIIFAFAAAIHVVHGQYEIGPLFVYAAAVLVSMSSASQPVPRSVV